jgi:hypothetical protein
VISRVTDRFRKTFRELPRPIQRKAREVFRLFRQDPHNPLLHLKQVHKTKPVYSIRISLGWRALAIKDGEQMIWFWIGSHADYDKILKQLS